MENKNSGCSDCHHQESEHPPITEGPCPVTPTPLSSFTNENTSVTTGPTTTRIKLPVVLAEPTIQIVAESNITLHPAATEIKRVKKNVFLNQVKLVPVGPGTRIDGTDFFTFARAKLFIAGHVRKNLEYATNKCDSPLHNRVVDIPFSGFTELTGATLINLPIFGINETSESSFLSDANNLNTRLDKFFFNNLVKLNEQPFGELVAANFFELDFSPTEPASEGTFTTLREKIVLELTVKVLQVQQLAVALPTVVPVLTGTTTSTTSTTSTTTTSTTTTSTTSTTSTTTAVPCQCSGTITAGNNGTPGTFANNNVDTFVPILFNRNIEGFVDIICDCTTGTIDQVDSRFRFQVNPADNFGFKFTSDTITSSSCAAGILTVMGTGTLSNLGSATEPAPGTYNYVLVLDSVTNTITITLTNPTTGMPIFLTVPFEPSNGQGKMVSVTACPTT